MALSDLDPARVPGWVEVGEVEDGAIGLTPAVQGPLGRRQLGGEVARGELARVDGKLEKNHGQEPIL